MKEMFRGIGNVHSFNKASGMKIFCGYAKLPELGLRPRLEFADLIERATGRQAERTIYANQNNYISLLDVFN